MNTHTLTQLLSLLADAKELNYSYEISTTAPPMELGFSGHVVRFYIPDEDENAFHYHFSVSIDVEPHQINHYSTVRKFFDEKLGLQRLRKTALAKLTAPEIEILGIKT
jgi:hypothetical protein